ncbi:MAG: peptide-methionine (S)-S-oxide reductase MsrA [Nitrososphaerota archaeon]|nr:peptide-methionine (S)-S-oxide reductase MsrA [Nitrososphaerota archaeon]
MSNRSDSLQLANIGGGCFWCIEAVYSELEGVVKAESGYAGGDFPNPSYEDVCSDETGHAEIVQITFDPKVITYREILQVFFSVHDPTTANRQGADVGTQYRSIILYQDAEQKRIAEEVMVEMGKSKIWPNQIVTQLVPLEKFYKAESYHQNYFKNNPDQGYCQMVIEPKVAKFRKSYFDRLKK